LFGRPEGGSVNSSATNSSELFESVSLAHGHPPPPLPLGHRWAIPATLAPERPRCWLPAAWATAGVAAQRGNCSIQRADPMEPGRRSGSIEYSPLVAYGDVAPQWEKCLVTGAGAGQQFPVNRSARKLFDPATGEMDHDGPVGRLFSPSIIGPRCFPNGQKCSSAGGLWQRVPSASRVYMMSGWASSQFLATANLPRFTSAH